MPRFTIPVKPTVTEFEPSCEIVDDDDSTTEMMWVTFPWGGEEKDQEALREWNELRADRMNQ